MLDIPEFTGSAEHRLGASQTRWKLAETVLGAPKFQIPATI
jgi:hypothetical protein